MARLTLYLFGPMSAMLDADEPIDFGYDKVRALLAYLAVEHERAHPRAHIAALLWPENPESAARHSLSQALSVLRGTLGDQQPERALLVANRDIVQFMPGRDCRIDAVEFEGLLNACEEHPHGDIPTCPDCIQRIERAIDLYRGDFLEGLLIDVPEFDRWLNARRESYRQRLQKAEQYLASYFERNGELPRACEIAGHLVERDPWDEQSQRYLMRLLAASGQRSAAIKQYVRCRNMLADELGVEPEPETTELYERVRDGLEGPSTRWWQQSSSTREISKLPTLTTPFVGRERELEQLSALFSGEDSHLITLTGPGGIGKTRLAIKAAEQIKARFPDGVHYIPLAGLTSSTWLPSTILASLSDPVEGATDAREQLLSYVEGRTLLLVLDNFEHLLDDAFLLSEMIERAPGLRVLVTSRERLNLSSERVFEVEGLDLPAGDDPTKVEMSSSARLFIERARRHKTNFVPWPVDWRAIARICRLTGGMPLGIELAAAWISVLSCEEIATEIERGVDFLSSTSRDVPERHKSIRAVFDHSWNLLTEVEQRAFRRLSVFRGGFRRAAAEYVTGTSLPILSALVTKSLIRREPNGRYEIHELLRQFGEEKLVGLDQEGEVVFNRHSDYFLGYLAVREERLQGADQVTVLKEIESERENLRTAWQRAVDCLNVPNLSRAAHGLWLFYEITANYQEGKHAFERATRALDASLADVDGDTEAQLALARLISRQGALSFRVGEVHVWEQSLQRSIERLRSLGNAWELGIALNYQAVLAHAYQDYALEEEFLRESISWCEQGNYRWALAYSLNDLGAVRLLLGHYAEAREFHRASLDIFEEIGDRRGLAFALRNLGVAARYLGDTEEAVSLLRRSLEIRQSLNNGWGIADSLNQLGIVLRNDGDLAGARAHFLESLKVASGINSLQLLPEILVELVPVLAEDGDTERVRSSLNAILRHPSSGVAARESAEKLLKALGAVDPNADLDHELILAIGKNDLIQIADDLIADVS